MKEHNDRVITVRDLIRSVARHWKGQYFDTAKSEWRYRDKLPVWVALSKLNLERVNAKEVAGVIGNDSWTTVRCAECQRDVDAVRTCGQPEDFESATASLCRDCLWAAITELDAVLADPKRNK